MLGNEWSVFNVFLMFKKINLMFFELKKCVTKFYEGEFKLKMLILRNLKF